MKYTVKTFKDEDINKRVGFFVKDDSDRQFAVDTVLPIVEGKTQQEYIQEALVEVKPKVDEWVESNQLIGVEINPDTGEPLGA